MNENIILAKQNITNIVKDYGAPYFYVNATKDYKNILSFGLNGEKEATGNEKVFLFSCTKLITVITTMACVEKGLLSLEDKAYQYLPFIKECFYINEKGEKEIIGERITIRHLLTMSAGFSYNIYNSDFLAFLKSNHNANNYEVIKEFCKMPLLFAPGEKFNYSFCHDVLSAIVEVVQNKPYSECVNEAIIKPLGLKDTHFQHDSNGLIDLYMEENDSIKKMSINGNPYLLSKNFYGGGAGLVGTANDYIKIGTALANGGRSEDGTQIISEGTLKLIRTPQIEKAFTTAQGNDYLYGLGVRTRTKETPWGLPVGEYGWDGAAGSFIMIDPVNKTSVFVCMHVRNWMGFRGKHIEIVREIYEHILNK